MRKRKRIWMIIGSLFLIILAFIGCNKITNNQKLNPLSNSEKEDYQKTGNLTNKSLIMSIGNINVLYDEASVYIRELKEQYQSSLGDTIWTYDLGNGKTFADMAKDEVINQISQLKIISLMAPKLGVEVTKEEKLEISQNVKKYLESVSDDFKAKYGITEELMTKTYTDNFLASKVFEIVTNDVNTEVSDDEAKKITIQQILIKTGGEDEEGNKIILTEKEKKLALKKARKLLVQAKKESDFYSFAEKNTDDIDVEYTFGKGEKSKAVEDAAFALKTGEFSNVVVGEDGYYILYCVSDYDEAATDEAKEAIIDERQNAAFEKEYEKWLKNYKVQLNSTMWDQVSFLTNEEKGATVETETPLASEKNVD